MTSFRPGRLKALILPPETAKLLAEIDQFRASPPTHSEAYLDENLAVTAALQGIESSLRMDGVPLPPGRLERLSGGFAMPNDDAERRVWNYRQARDWVNKKGDELKVTLDNVQRLHGTILDRLPGEGEWSSAQAKAAVGELCQGHRSALFDGVSPIVAAAALMLDFLDLQPFTDANGRAARLLAAMSLFQGGITVQKHVSLERIMERTKAEYDSALRASSEGWRGGDNDLVPWISYFAGAVHQAFKEFAKPQPQPKTEPAKPVGKPRTPPPEPVEQATTDDKPRTTAILVGIDACPKIFTTSQLKEKCPGPSIHTIRIILRKLKDAGKLRAVGFGRKAAWEKLIEKFAP